MLLYAATLWIAIACQAAPVRVPARAAEDIIAAAALTDAPGIVWDESTLTRVSPKGYQFAGYPRMVQLADGDLLCVFEADGSIMATRSTNLGSTWSAVTPIAWRDDDRAIKMAAPELLQLHDGSLLACYNERPYKISGSRCFGIRTKKSYDGGRSWKQARLIYEAGHKFNDGCWEPAAIQLPTGEVQVYFADEGSFLSTNDQCIAMLKSPDGGLTWNAQPTIVSYRPFARDGMPAPLLLAGGEEIVCAIEDLGWLGNFKPAIVRTSAAAPWVSPVGPFSGHRNLALAHPLKRFTYAGAPNLRQLHSGDTVLSYQGTEGRGLNSIHVADMKVCVGDSRARYFDRKSVPFKIPRNRSALWNSLAVLDNDTVVALTSTNAYSKEKQVWMIKGRLKAH